MTFTEMKSKAQLRLLNRISLGSAIAAIALIHLFRILMSPTAAIEIVVDALLSLAVIFALVHFIFRFVLRIHRETERRTEEIAALQETMLDITSQLDMPRLLTSIIERASRLVGATGGLIHLYDAERQELRCYISHNLDKDYTGLTLALGEGVAGKVVQRGEPLIVADHRTWEGKSPQLTDAEVKGVIGVPLKWQEEIIGVLDIMDTSGKKAFDEHDIRLLSLFADQAALAIQNARLYTALQQRAQMSEVLLDIAQAATASLELTRVLKLIAQRTAQACEVDRCTILLLEEGEKLVPAMSQFASGRVDEEMWRLFKDIRYPRLLAEVPEVQQVLREGRSLFIPNALASSLPRHWIEPFHAESVLIVPLISKGQPVGVMGLDYMEEGKSFSEEQVNLAMTIGAQVATIIQNARLYQQVQDRVRELSALTEVGQAINRALSLEEILDIVLQEAMALIGYEAGSIILLDRRTNTWRIVANCGIPAEVVEEFNRRPVYAHEGTFGIVLETGDMLEIADARSDPRVLHDVGQVPEKLTNVPLRTEEGVIGVIALDGLPPDERARRLLLALADLAAVAIQRLRLLEEERRQRQEADTLRRAAQALSSTLDLPQVFETILSELQRVVPYDSASVQLLKGDHLEIIGGRGFPNLDEILGISFPVEGNNPNREVMRSLEPFILEDAPAVYEDFTREPFSQMGIRSWLGVPMLIGQRPVGMITLDKCQPGFYTQEHARLALAFAAQAAVAIENARLFEEARRRVAELETLQRTSLQLISSMDLSSVLDSIAESALALVGATDCHIYLYDEASETFTFGAALWNNGRQEPAVKAPRRDGFTATVARRGQAMVINDAAHHPLYTTPEAKKWGLQAIAGFPLKRAGQVLGVFNIAFLEPHTFSEEELRVLSLLADQAAIAIENARLYEEAQRRLQEMSLLNEINSILTSTLDLEDMLTSFMQGVCQAMGVEAGSLFLLDEEREEMVFFVALGEKGAEIRRSRMPLGVGIAGWVVQHGEPLLVPDARQDPRHYSEVDRLAGFVTRSILCVPMKIRDKVLGCIEVINKIKGEFTQDDLRLLSAVAASAAAATENAQLYEEIKQHLSHLEERVAERTAEIQRAKERTEAILHSVADAVIVTDLEGNIVEVNPVAERWLTFHGDGWEVPNVPLHRLVRQLAKGDLAVVDSTVEFPDLTQPGLQACWEELECDKVDCPAYGAEDRRCWLILGTLCGPKAKKALSAEEKYETCRECPLYQRLKPVSFQASASPLTEGGQVIGWVIVLHDVTRLHELDRLKSEFVSNVSHELRTPLTNIKIYLSLLRKGRPDEEKQEQYLQTVVREVARLEKLIEDLLDLSRLETGAARPEKEPLDVTEVVQQVLLVHQPLAESKNIKLSSELPPEMQPLWADRDQMIQLLTNLLGNALNYTPPGGEVTVRAASVRRDGHSWLTLAVQDTGLGIPPEEQERIFDRFYRGKEARHMAPGTGLGLAIVKEILALHDGFIELESEVGMGSTFTAWLPLETE